VNDNLDSNEPRPWIDKFGAACRGIKIGIRGQSSFFAHFFISAMVIVAGVVLGVSQNEWFLLVICITGVLTAEMINSAIERLSRAITDEYDEMVRDALQIGSGAVLLASVGAAVVGSFIFYYRLGVLLGWWA
jgi:diacylglycerol kinase